MDWADETAIAHIECEYILFYRSQKTGAILSVIRA
jgi:hypothetical protein